MTQDKSKVSKPIARIRATRLKGPTEHESKPHTPINYMRAAHLAEPTEHARTSLAPLHRHTPTPEEARQQVLPAPADGQQHTVSRPTAMRTWETNGVETPAGSDGTVSEEGEHLAFTQTEQSEADEAKPGEDVEQLPTRHLPAVSKAKALVVTIFGGAPGIDPQAQEEIEEQATLQLSSVEQERTAVLPARTPPTAEDRQQSTLLLPAVSDVADKPTAQVEALPEVGAHLLNRAGIAMRNIIGNGLARLQEPQPEGPVTRGLWTVKPGITPGLFPLLALTNALGLSLVSISYYLSQYGAFDLEIPFLLGLLVIFVPNVLRLLSSSPTRLERLYLICALGITFYLVAFMESPLHIGNFDAFLHWVTADNLLRTGSLFGNNSMLPVSPYYPGLEIITNAISSITGLSTFYASIPPIIASRLLMVIALFLFYEQITRSSRMAGIATLIYTANPHFLFFDSVYSYETLALPLAICVLYILARYEQVGGEQRWIIFTSWLVLLALTFTHHMTDFVFNGLLLLWFAISFFSATARKTRIHLASLAIFGIAMALAYAFLVGGNPVWSYLSSYFNTAFIELEHIITGTGSVRPLFTGTSTGVAPIWDRLLMLGAVAIVSFALPFGLLTLWHIHRRAALPMMLGIFALAYPLTQAFRFTPFGSEIPDRSAAFLFIAVGYIITILITHFWPSRTLSKKTVALVTCALSIILLGGVILEAGPGYADLPGPYLVGADGRSVEPEGVNAAIWAQLYLGPNHRVGTDRTNQMLMSTYGDQHVVTEIGDLIDVSPLFYSATFTGGDQTLVRAGNIQYVVVDMRLSTALPALGFYFVSDESEAKHLTTPISQSALTKFDTLPQINRVFDSGNLVIYDTGALLTGPGS